MLRFSIIILLVTAMLTQSLSRGIIVLSYFTNKEAYERYCVNKAKPQLHCDGKCQVAQKIKQEEERDQKDPLKNSRFSEVVFIDQHAFIRIEPVFTPVTLNSYLLPLSIGHAIAFSRTFFHPPNAVC